MPQKAPVASAPFKAVAYYTTAVGGGPYHPKCYNDAKRSGWPEIRGVLDRQLARWPKGKACPVCKGKTARVRAVKR